MASTFALRQDRSSAIFYIHWTQFVARGKPGRSKRVSTRTRDKAEAQKILGRLLASNSLNQRPAGACPLCGAFPGAAAQTVPAETGPVRALGSAREHPEQAPPTATVAELWTLYFDRHVQRNTASVATAGNSWRNLEMHFGRLKVSKVNQETVDAYAMKRRRGSIGLVSVPATVRRELSSLRACFNWCASPKRKILGKDEVPAFDLPPEGEPNDRWLRPDEIDKLKVAAAAISRRLDRRARMSRGERFLWLGLETAARSEAIRQLTWDRVDWQARTIDYNVPGRQRTKKRRAVVPISKALEPVLRRMHDERINDYVLDSDRPILRTIKNIAARAGVAHVSPHVLRHTAATLMARAGVPLWKIAKALGNSVSLVERVYAKHDPSDLRDAVDKISGPADDEN